MYSQLMDHCFRSRDVPYAVVIIGSFVERFVEIFARGFSTSSFYDSFPSYASERFLGSSEASAIFTGEDSGLAARKIAAMTIRYLVSICPVSTPGIISR